MVCVSYEKYFKRKSISGERSAKESNVQKVCKNTHIVLNLDDLPFDPRLRPHILSYDPNIRDEVRRSYLQKGPCQLHAHDYEQTKINSISRQFVPAWIKKYENWLEYNVINEVDYCLCCYLFKPKQGVRRT